LYTKFHAAINVTLLQAQYTPDYPLNSSTSILPDAFQPPAEHDPLIARNLSQNYDVGLAFSSPEHSQKHQSVSVDVNWKGEMSSHPDLVPGKQTSGFFSRFRSYNINTQTPKHKNCKKLLEAEDSVPTISPQVLTTVNECEKMASSNASDFRTSSV